MSPKRERVPGSVGSRSLYAGLFGLGSMVLLLAMQPASHPASQPGAPSGEARFIGAKKCKSCHRAEAVGDQFGAWSEAKHAKAWEVLGGDEAKKLGAAVGIADPQQSGECLRCHVTAFGEDESRFKGKFDPKLGVQCESCHGPGSEHMAARFTAAASLGEGEELPPYTEIPAGEIISSPPMKTCLGCHNAESPSFKSFCFYERVAKIRHLNPLHPRTAEERAALLVCGCGDACGCVEGCEPEECGVAPEEESGDE